MHVTPFTFIAEEVLLSLLMDESVIAIDTSVVPKPCGIFL
jgi:hypothetical protein